MNGKLINKQWRAYVVVLVCGLAIISTALFITVNLSPLFVDYPHRLLIHWSRGQLAGDYRRLLLYLQVPWVRRLHLAALPLPAGARAHFQAVRHLLLLNEAVLMVALPLAWRMVGKQKRRGQLWQLIAPLMVLGLVVLMLAWLPLINFPTSFIRLHYLLFTDRNWIFNARTAPIILMMPTAFFGKLFALFLGICLLLGSLFFIWLRWQSGLLKLRLQETDDGRN
ncbi:TIGR01906 family membrane protein [Limosilactobacillus sp.]|jgi:integral membrane protein (TIGR01906 family)|uniref:TIGR01906 family membrane protein n=1 Tax=Limosilactobacillus sp. TaxID=2773925 RepID=UPI0025C5AF28|nr:TIGR01906 family membrane protein [Limosilactobacillus sp.]MCH3922466.1 TIGR01906 family membrane protein [Limosilactobacillus sp.]MCH3927148.1 TIGR01906 family membrane protein [Limosilactobacillus sp.]